MEALIVVIVLLILWTNEALFGNKSVQAPKPEAEAPDLAELLKKYVEANLEANPSAGKKD
jgi:hypothetical protein